MDSGLVARDKGPLTLPPFVRPWPAIMHFSRGIRLAVSKQIVSQANVLVFGGLIALLAVIGFTTWDRFDAARSARLWTQHTHDVLGATRELEIGIREAETDERGYLRSGRDEFVAAHEAAVTHATNMIGEL